MAEFTQVRKKGPAMKYSEHQQTLVEMGFDAVDVTAALETVNGNIEFAMAILLGEPIPSVAGGSYTSRAALAPMKVVGKSQSSSATLKTLSKPDIKEIHSKFMATYKIQKCKEKNSHDKRMCTGYHTKGDRRRNPFEILYACTECPTSPTETTNCPDGDNCLKAHNMLERMFHPELFKISMCQRGPNGSHCERGNLCAFAHSDEDHRIPLSHTLNKAAQLAAIASEPLVAGKSMGDSRLLDSVQDKLIRLIKSQGTEGIISSELPKRFSDVYFERLDLTDEAGEKFRIKDLLLAHPCISVTMHKGVQPKYVWGEERYSLASTTPIMPIPQDAPMIAVAPKVIPVNISIGGIGLGGGVNSIGGSKPITSWASAVSSPAPVQPVVPPPAAVVQPVVVASNSVVEDVSVRGRRRGPSSVPSSNHSLEVDSSPLLSSYSVDPLYISENTVNNVNNSSSFDLPQSTEYTGIASSSLDYNTDRKSSTSSTSSQSNSGIGFGSLPPAPGLSGLLGVSFSPSPSPSALSSGLSGVSGAQLGSLGSTGLLPRRRGPSGPTDDLSMSFLGTQGFGVGGVGAASSSPKVPPGFGSNTSSPRGEATSMVEYAERLNNSNNVCNALQTQVNNLQGDLIQKSRELDQQNVELKEIQHRLSSFEDISDSETKDTLSVEILKFRNELYASQQVIRVKDEEILKINGNISELEGALKISESAKNVLLSELHNTRAKLKQTELDYESSRSHYAELDRARNMLQSEVDSLRSQLGGGGRVGPTANEIQLQNMNAALSRDRDELVGYITKMNQSRLNEESMDHSRGRFEVNNGYQHQQGSSNNCWDTRMDGQGQGQIDYSNNQHMHNGNHMQNQQNNQQNNQNNQNQQQQQQGQQGQQGIQGNLQGYIMNADKICSFPGCSLEGKYLCVCQTTRYCGSLHQREHWDFHQSECRPLKR